MGKKGIKGFEMDYVRQLIDQARESIRSCDELSEHAMWSRQGPEIWQARRFIGTPTFYPVYRYENFYSYSPLSLILMKGVFRLNDSAARKVPTPKQPYFSGTETIDREITRIGGPPKAGFTIKEGGEYARRIAEAMRLDASSIEDANPGLTNVILCGGKDSLNMLFLPWKNPVVLASAPPNYELVKNFLKDNHLKFDLIRLDDDDRSLLEHEILVNCCRNDLEHCRWGPQLRNLAKSFDGKIVYWKGQLGSTFLSPVWKRYTHPPNTAWGWITRRFAALGHHGEYRFKVFMERIGMTQLRLLRTMWRRGAMWQGAHASIIRQLTGALTVSIYHGPAIQKVIWQVDFFRAVQEDVRPLIGESLHGGPVVYPSDNPTPPPSTIRKDVSHLEPFLKALSSTGIRVQTD